MENSIEKGPHKDIERTITCPTCDNDLESRKNCGRCKGQGFIKDRR
ncbi:hypothetical protein IMCC3317_09210 [Kordia antarctica]|uniref:Uncharacterized protein n=1 Tax=Kordia antarctica TaxID=1218801 RepID=A0A7L4ZG31_9FLAO|nr:hypothetical protein IMCC3317_09210 [Kordia antarctica]